MQTHQASETALRAARARARHQLLDARPVLHDPVTPRLLAPHEPPGWERQGEGPVARAFRGGVVARSRLAEDALAQAVQQGVRQYVLLGAGLDSFGLRNPHGGLRVFEVDHPATQARKRDWIARAGLQVPAQLRFVPVDFDRAAWRDALVCAGWRPDAPTFFAWLGVMWYLHGDAVRDTLRQVGGCPRGSGITFDAWHRPAPRHWGARLKLALLRRRYARLGEPWLTFFTQDEQHTLLERCGFSHVQLHRPQDINQALFGDPAHRHLAIRAGSLYSVTTAWV